MLHGLVSRPVSSAWGWQAPERLHLCRLGTYYTFGKERETASVQALYYYFIVRARRRSLNAVCIAIYVKLLRKTSLQAVEVSIETKLSEKCSFFRYTDLAGAAHVEVHVLIRGEYRKNLASSFLNIKCYLKSCGHLRCLPLVISDCDYVRHHEVLVAF